MIHVGLHFEEGLRMPTMLVSTYVTLLTCDICDILCLLIIDLLALQEGPLGPLMDVSMMKRINLLAKLIQL